MNGVVLNPVGSAYCSWLRYAGVDDAAWATAWHHIAWLSPVFDGLGVLDSIRLEMLYP